MVAPAMAWAAVRVEGDTVNLALFDEMFTLPVTLVAETVKVWV
jgi:hypothetical protein